MSEVHQIEIPSPYVPRDAEHIVISALLMSGGQDRDLDAMVFGRIPDESYFGIPEMAAAYAFILEARKSGRPSSFPAVGQFFHATYGKERGGLIIRALQTWCAQAWESYKLGGFMREVWRRQLIDAIQTIVEANAEAVLRNLKEHGAPIIIRQDGSPDLMASLAALEEQTGRLKEQVAWNGGDTFKTIREATAMALDNIGAAMRGESADSVTTGFPDLDDLTGGLPVGEITVVGARPAMGKTTFGMAVAANAARRGHGVCVFSLEMDAERLVERLLSASMAARGIMVPYRNLRTRAAEKLGREVDEALIGAAQELDSLPITISDKAGLTAMDIRAKLLTERRRMEASGQELRLAVIDYLGLLRSTVQAHSKALEIAEITRELRETASDLGIAILLLSQLNRGVESREDKRPGLHDLRDSGAIEQDAAQVLFLFREEYYLERDAHDVAGGEKAIKAQARLMEVRNTLEVIVAKNRFGPTGKAVLYANMATASIGARVWREQPEQEEINYGL